MLVSQELVSPSASAGKSLNVSIRVDVHTFLNRAENRGHFCFLILSSVFFQVFGVSVCAVLKTGERATLMQMRESVMPLVLSAGLRVFDV